jgi:excisionase family DNA binding protein
MMTIKQAARRLNVSEKTVRNLIKSGRLGHHRIGAGSGVIRISEQSLAEHLAECEVRESGERTSPVRRQRTTLRHIDL